MRSLQFAFIAIFSVAAFAEPPPPVESEVCVYGGTPAGVMAAVAAAWQGHSVAGIAFILIHVFDLL